MTQYIDKSDVVAKIEGLKERYALCPTHNNYEEGLKEGRLIGYKDALDKINTIEVKEADLEKELDTWRHNHFHGRRDKDAAGEYLERSSQLDIAKHFFELGLKARIDKELVEEVYSHLDSIKDTADRMTSGNFMHHRAAIKFSANTIAKVLELIGLKTQKGE